MPIGPAPRLLAALALLGVGHAAHGAMYSWQFDRGATPGNYATSAAAGSVERILSSFDTSTKRLTFDVFFGGTSGSGPMATQGFWLVLNNGPNPKGTPGELAIFYFDASKVFAGLASNPTMTVYEYNGRDGGDSWANGDGDAAGSEPGDFNGLIKGRNDAPGYINAITAQDVTLNGQARRRMSFDINASDIINRSPAYPVAGTDWYGTGFDSKLGIWMHPLAAFNAAYAPTGRGQITSLSFGAQGWFDGSDFTTVPNPGAGVLLGVGALLLAGRRKTR